jgi:hypothetical protein
VLSIELSWQEAGSAAAGLLAAATAARLSRRERLVQASAFGMEAALLFGLFGLWQLAGSFSVIPPGGAARRGAWIWHAERLLHMPSEAAVQRAFLPFPPIIELFNLYYAALHFVVLIGCLVWLFVRHRSRYPRVRTTVVLFTAGALLVQLIPVAPPRLLPLTGMVDTALRYGQSVYGSDGGLNPDQLSALPSVHIGWALLVAVAVVHISRSRWRWLALGYPALTTLVVVVTANHYWFDGLAAAALLGVALLVQRAGLLARRWLRARRARRRAVVSVPAVPSARHPVWVPFASGPAGGGQPGNGAAAGRGDGAAAGPDSGAGRGRAAGLFSDPGAANGSPRQRSLAGGQSYRRRHMR